MLKYHKELETPDKIVLPLVNKYPHKFHDFSPPYSFYEKYASIFEDLKNLNSFIKNIEINKLYDAVPPFLSYEEHDAIYSSISQIENLIYDDGVIPYIKILLPSFESGRNYNSIDGMSEYCSIDCLLSFYKSFLMAIFDIYPKLKDYYENTYKLINEALDELKNKYKIEYYDTEDCSILYPNAWFITPYGDLYDKMSKMGHQEENLLGPMRKVRNRLKYMTSPTIDETYYLEELKEYKRLLENRYVTFSEFKNYLNYVNYPAVIKLTEEDFTYFKNPFEEKTYDHRVFKTVLGVVSAQIAFYKFFSDLARYTKNPSKEYEKVMDMAKDRRSEILVRCAGFHKVETSLKKTITTSCVTDFKQFEEYLCRGWDIAVTTPIIINREKGIVEEIDITSPYIEHYIGQKIDEVNNSDNPERGKVYYRHLGYGKI